jgi:Leucine-rich repeat (LRR) protein
MQAQRGNSTILDLSGCNLVELPPEAATHAEWVTLDLGFNKFEKCTPGVKRYLI